MKMNLALFGAVASLTLSALGCGQMPVTGGTTDSGTTVSDAGGDAGTSTKDAGTSSSNDGGVSLNGCTDAKFIDSTANTNTNVAFGGALGDNFSPPCVTIAVGRSVTFKGQFSFHNLNKGSPSDVNAGSPNNPITEVTGGSEKVVTFPSAGDYPYICEFHNPGGMMGVVRVR